MNTERLVGIFGSIFLVIAITTMIVAPLNKKPDLEQNSFRDNVLTVSKSSHYEEYQHDIRTKEGEGTNQKSSSLLWFLVSIGIMALILIIAFHRVFKGSGSNMNLDEEEDTNDPERSKELNSISVADAVETILSHSQEPITTNSTEPCLGSKDLNGKAIKFPFRIIRNIDDAVQETFGLERKTDNQNKRVIRG